MVIFGGKHTQVVRAVREKNQFNLVINIKIQNLWYLYKTQPYPEINQPRSQGSYQMRDPGTKALNILVV